MTIRSFFASRTISVIAHKWLRTANSLQEPRRDERC